MAAIEKRGDAWRAKVRTRGVVMSRTFATKREAEYWASDTERQIRAGKGLSVRGLTLNDLLDRFQREVVPTRNSAAWEANRIAFFQRDAIAKVKLSDLTPAVLDEWQRRRLTEVSGGTHIRDRALLSVVLRTAVRVWRLMPESPLADVPLPKDNPRRERITTDDEIRRLEHVAGTSLQTVQSRVIAAFRFAVETGMRGGEIAALTRADAPPGRTWVRVRESKNGDARDVPLSPAAIELLDRVRALNLVPALFGFTVRQKDAIFRKMTKKAGIDGLNFHDSRATAVTRLSKRLDIMALAAMIGHRDLQSLRVYYRDTAEDIAKRLA